MTAAPRTTIFAPATAPGRAGLAVIRISGPEAGRVLGRLAGPLPPPRRARRARLRHPDRGDLLDDALILWFPAPASYTGEDVAELHIHGGRAVREAVMAALAAQPGLRLADPGEFTRRAVLNDRMDATEAEALIDLIDAETEAQRRQAIRQANGALRDLCDDWRDRALTLLAHLEAVLDFPDEEDLSPAVDQAVDAGIAALRADMVRVLDDQHRGERLREGLHVAVVGAPNAGKSSLVNRLARREAAIVSETAGTTRDVVEVHLNLGGYPLSLADTAGLRDTTCPIEAEGVRRARARMAAADLILWVGDGSPPGACPAAAVGFDGPDAQSGAMAREGDPAVPVIRVWTRGDLWPNGTRPPMAADGDVVLSCTTGAGLAHLETRLERQAQSLLDSGLGEAAVLTRARHRAAVEEARDALARAEWAPACDLKAEDLRLVLRALGRITGRVQVDELLDVIFRDFCLGK